MVFFFQNRSWSRIGRATNKIIPKARITRPTRSSSKIKSPINIIRCIRIWNIVADELNLCMNALNDFKQAMVEYYKTAFLRHPTVGQKIGQKIRQKIGQEIGPKKIGRTIGQETGQKMGRDQATNRTINRTKDRTKN